MRNNVRDRHDVGRGYEDDEDAPRRRNEAAALKLRTIGDLDQRTRAAKLARRLIAELESDLGGDLTAAQKELVQRAGLLSAILEDAEARWLDERRVNLALYGMLADRQRRILESLGLGRAMRNVTPRNGDLMGRIVNAVRMPSHGRD